VKDWTKAKFHSLVKEVDEISIDIKFHYNSNFTDDQMSTWHYKEWSRNVN